MIAEDYVSFETAKLLKEKGFDWCESPFYSEQDRDEWGQNNSYTIPNMLYDPDLPFDSETLTMVAPHVSIQMAMKWLRNIHDIVCSVGLFTDLPEMPPYWSFNILNQSTANVMYEAFDVKCETYEEAAEAAIKYCLENLI